MKYLLILLLFVSCSSQQEPIVIKPRKPEDVFHSKNIYVTVRNDTAFSVIPNMKFALHINYTPLDKYDRCKMNTYEYAKEYKLGYTGFKKIKRPPPFTDRVQIFDFNHPDFIMWGPASEWEHGEDYSYSIVDSIMFVFNKLPPLSENEILSKQARDEKSRKIDSMAHVFRKIMIENDLELHN